MTLEEFDSLIGNPESTNLEFRAQFGLREDRDRDVKTMVAFYNTDGGKLVFGVEEIGKNRRIIGLTQDVQTIESNLVSKIRGKSNLEPLPFIEIIEMGGHKCIVVNCPRGENPPYRTDGKVYIRKGSNSVEATEEEIANLYRSNSSTQDKQLVPSADFNDLDLNLIKNFLEVREGVQIIEGDLNKLLLRMGFIGIGIGSDKSYHPTIAGLLLFGKNPQNTLTHAKIKAEVKYKESNKDWDVISEITGNLLEQIKQLIQFVNQNIKVSAKIEGFERTEKPLIPIEAIREAIVNALVHRDYRDPSSEIHFRIHGNKVMVENPGGLMSPLTIDEILSGEFIPKTRNPIIADVITQMGFMDKRGTGVLRMKTLMKKADLPEPTFLSITNGFRVIFEGSEDKNKKTGIFIPKEELEKHNLSKEHKAILKFIEKNGEIKTKDCIELLSKSKGTAIAKLNELKSIDFIEQTSLKQRDPNTAYKIHSRFLEQPNKKKLSTPENVSQSKLF